MIKSALGIIGSTESPSREWLQALHADQLDEKRKSVWWSRLLLLFQEIDPGYQFDTPLPESVKRVQEDTEDGLESSIGELAPRGLR